MPSVVYQMLSAQTGTAATLNDSPFLTLAAALLGAIVGGVLSLLGSYWATRSTSKANLKLAEQERTKREQGEQRAAVSAVLAEIRLNQKIASSSLINTNALPLFTKELWDANMGILSFVDEKAGNSLLAGYVALNAANTIAAYTLARLNTSGERNDSYKAYVRDLVQQFTIAEQQLDKWLKFGKA